MAKLKQEEKEYLINKYLSRGDSLKEAERKLKRTISLITISPTTRIKDHVSSVPI